MKTKINILSILFLSIVSCFTTKTHDESQLETQELTNTTWELIELEGQEIDQSEKKNNKIHFTLNKADQKITGFTGCNHFNGNFDLEDAYRLSFSEIASTRMACPKLEINESKFIEILNMTDNYRIQADKLYLNIGKRAPLAVFRKVNSQEKIVEKYWKLIKLDGQNIKMDDNQEREVYFRLKSDDQTMTGFAGCNTLNGEYKLMNGNRIQFSRMSTTMKLCPDVDFNESEFLEVFELADNYTIHNDKLSLNIGKRAPLAVFEAVYF